MDPISCGLGDLGTETHFHAIVIGSGYGGGVSACRLARAGRKVCVLERGREILPGSYPRELSEAIGETQVTTAKGGNLTPGRNGMLDLRINDDINVIIGCGLGGTSLINANVALETDPRTFQDARWPQAFRQDGVLDPYYAKARAMLGSNPLPHPYAPPKLKALEVSARAIGAPCERPDINVTFADGPNAAGLWQAKCTMCGDCCSGCNYGAKNTVLMNYLQDAHGHGARVVTQAKVITIGKATTQGARWEVIAADISDPKISRDHRLTADTVVLAAGTLGSTEILLRSARNEDNPLPLAAAALGQGFSGNGDVLAFGFDANWEHRTDGARAPVYGIGAGTNSAEPDQPQFCPGPCITGVIKVDMGTNDDVRRGLVIEEGVAPGALSLIYPAVFFMEEALHGEFFRFPDLQQRLLDAKALGEALMNGTASGDLCYTGALSRTQSFLLMSHDQSDGIIRFNDKTDTVEVQWPGVGDSYPYNRDNAILRRCSDGIWANFIADPVWYPAFGKKLLTVHPVGGCRMGESAATGVVNDRCQVFTGNDADVHDGLYVCDGSVMPTSLGLNPLLTISAIAERAMDLLIEERGWKPSAVASRVAVRARDAQPPGLRERLGELEADLKAIVALIGRGADKAAADALQKLIDGLITKFVHDPGNRSELLLIWDTAVNALNWHPEYLAQDVQPTIEKLLLPFVEGIRKRLGSDSPGTAQLGAVIAFLQETMGDFSPGLSFAETMSGFVAAPVPAADGAISDPYEICERLGRADPGRNAMQARFRVAAASLDELTEGPSHQAGLDGTVRCPFLSDHDLKIAEGSGTFRLLVQDAARVETWQMIYTCRLAPNGAAAADPAFYFEGIKTLARRPGSDWWSDLTTLSVDVYKGADRQGQLVARGVIRLGLQELIAQATTIETHFPPVPDDSIIIDLARFLEGGQLYPELEQAKTRQRLVRWLLAQDKTAAKDVSLYFEAKLAAFFAMLIFRTYGGVLAYMNNFPALAPPADALPAPGEPLRKGSAAKVEWVPFQTSGGVELSFLRCKGGARGPVILAPGFATRAASFAMRTVDRNLAEVLCGEGFDVWMLDYRGSPALGATSLVPFTIDDVATEDWPAAVDKVLDASGAADVQVVAHCMGSMTCLMALLSGRLETAKVRSLIASQLTVHPVTNWFNKMKADTGLAGLIRNGVPASLHGLVEELAPNDAIAELFFGLECVDANSTTAPGPCGGKRYLQDQALDLLAWNAPFPNGLPCYSPTCHRIFGIYGPVYLHDQLNQQTHLAIQEVFGRISTKPFEQIGLMTRLGRAVDAQGRDVYLPHPERLAVPITFIAGALNEEFLPDTSLKTYDWLCKANGNADGRYARHVFANYGHMDCFIGKDAGRDIFPYILDRLKRTAAG